jgi:hypothetical protein
MFPTSFCLDLLGRSEVRSDLMWVLNLASWRLERGPMVAGTSTLNVACPKIRIAWVCWECSETAPLALPVCSTKYRFFPSDSRYDRAMILWLHLTGRTMSTPGFQLCKIRS